MLVHGWLDTVFSARWLTDLKNALLKHGDYNVILVDWKGGNGLPYTQASVNTRVVGAEMGLLVKKLQVRPTRRFYVPKYLNNSKNAMVYLL